jgi:CRP-like cAMP-binding protein
MTHRGISLENLRSAMQLAPSAKDMLTVLLGTGRLQKFAAGEAIRTSMSLTPCWPIVVSGQVRIYIEKANAEEFTLYNANPGECCTLWPAGRESDFPMPVKAVAVADSVLLMVPVGYLREWTHRRHWGEYQARMSDLRLRIMTEHIAHLAFRSAARRRGQLLDFVVPGQRIS